MASLDWPLATIPDVRLAGRFPLADMGFATTYRGQAHALHLHDYAGRMRLANTEVTLEPGDATISPLGLASAYDLPAPGWHWCIHFRECQADGNARMELPLHLRLGAAATAVRERMAHIGRLQERAGESPLASASAAIALQDLLLWLAERTVIAERGNSAAEKVALLIDERFHESLTMPGIAQAAGCSQATLARQFRARFGITVSHRLIERRTAHARYLLESTDLPMWRIAERVGIPDPQYFNKTVRRLLGASPSAIRASAAGAPVIDPDR
ncbi:MAG: helix-turn-helix transcriptional regulator [Sphingomicrobium sp.]|nr:helix-turn-helix transcriptional regulator [Sphingomonadales bacterium]